VCQHRSSADAPTRIEARAVWADPHDPIDLIDLIDLI
jgi:hypothetical protein